MSMSMPLPAAAAPGPVADEAHGAGTAPGAWPAFVRALADHLAGQWPAMPDRLGDRYTAFVDLAVQHAQRRGLLHAPSVARYVNLVFVWGPAFEDKPGFAWARALWPPAAEPAAGADAPDQWQAGWRIQHQLLQRSLAELQALPDSRIAPATLRDADARLLDRFGALGHCAEPHPAEAQPSLPRVACDIEAAELRLPDSAAVAVYRLVQGDWQRGASPVPPPLRVDATHGLPTRISLLSPAAGAAVTRLQLRVKPHAQCSDTRHPAVQLLGPLAHAAWVGAETRALGSELPSRVQVDQPGGPGTAIAQDTSPELYRLAIDSCGLRDEGTAVGPLQTRVQAWPATQWWLELTRSAPAAQTLLPGPRAWARGLTRCRVERDGQPADAAALKAVFDDGLDAELAVALQRLAAAWEQLPGLQQPGLEAQMGLLTGRAALTWGWQLGPGGLDSDAWMRLVAQLELQALQASLQFSGELGVAGVRGRIGLQLEGQVPLAGVVQRDGPEPTLPAVSALAALTAPPALPALTALLPLVAARWRLPFTARLDALAADHAALLQLAGPCSGALVGEAGLRANTHGGSGWEWFATLRLEAVAVPLQCTDPLLGVREWLQPLLPAAVLMQWSQR